jgi:hypothetical protein
VYQSHLETINTGAISKIAEFEGKLQNPPIKSEFLFTPYYITKLLTMTDNQKSVETSAIAGNLSDMTINSVKKHCWKNLEMIA